MNFCKARLVCVGCDRRGRWDLRSSETGSVKGSAVTIAKQVAWGCVTVGMIVASALPAWATRLAFTGKVMVDEQIDRPLSGVRIRVEFHGHEVGIHEYTTTRSTRGMTDEEGNFEVALKMSEYRYHWTHAIVEIPATEENKAIVRVIPLENDGNGGCVGSKQIEVPPMPYGQRQ